MEAVRNRLGRLKREEMGEEEWQRAEEERQRAKADEEDLVRQRAKEIWQRGEEEEARAKEEERQGKPRPRWTQKEVDLLIQVSHPV